MLHARIDSQAAIAANSCNVCCCEPVEVRAGMTELMVIDYTAWSVPIAAAGGRGFGCSPQFNVEQLTTCPEPTGDDPLITTTVTFDLVTADDPALLGDLAPAITPATGVTFIAVPFHGPYHGTVLLQGDGTFTYTPVAGFNGVDRFFVKAQYNGEEQIFEVLVGVNVAEPTTDDATPAIKIINAQADQRNHLLRFALQVSPAAPSCATYRLRVRMDAYDCTPTCYWQDSCYDLSIGRCR